MPIVSQDSRFPNGSYVTETHFRPMRGPVPSIQRTIRFHHSNVAKEGHVKKTVALGCLLSLTGFSSCISKNQSPAVSPIIPPLVQTAPEPARQLTALEQLEHDLLDYEFADVPSEQLAAAPTEDLGTASATTEPAPAPTVELASASNTEEAPPASTEEAAPVELVEAPPQEPTLAEQLDEHLLDAPPLIQYHPRGTFASVPTPAAGNTSLSPTDFSPFE
jgi:hypothetical protein